MKVIGGVNDLLNNKLFFVCLALLLILVLEFIVLALTTSAPASGVQTYQSPNMDEFTQAPADNDKKVEMVLSKPIFYPDRHAEAYADMAINQASRIGDWLLTGVVQTEGKSLVMFREVKGEKQITLSQGMKLDRWVISQVQANKVIFEVDGEEFEMILPIAVIDDQADLADKQKLNKTTTAKEGGSRQSVSR